MQVAVVDDLVEDIRGVGPRAEVAHPVDHHDAGMGVGRQGLAESSLTRGGGQVVDQGRRGCEGLVEAVLDGPVGDGHR